MCAQTILMLFFLACVSMPSVAVASGQGNQPLSNDDADVTAFVNNASRAQVLHAAEQPLLSGADLLPFVQPGPTMGKLIKKAYNSYYYHHNHIYNIIVMLTNLIP